MFVLFFFFSQSRMFWYIGLQWLQRFKHGQKIENIWLFSALSQIRQPQTLSPRTYGGKINRKRIKSPGNTGRGTVWCSCFTLESTAQFVQEIWRINILSWQGELLSKFHLLLKIYINIKVCGTGRLASAV